MSPLTPAAAGAQATTRRVAVLWVVAALGLAGPWLVLALAPLTADTGVAGAPTMARASGIRVMPGDVSGAASASSGSGAGPGVNWNGAHRLAAGASPQPPAKLKPICPSRVTAFQE